MPAEGVGPRCVWTDEDWRCPDEAEPGTVPLLCDHHFTLLTQLDRRDAHAQMDDVEGGGR